MKATKIMLFITALAMVLGACKPTEQATYNKAERLWHKAYRVNKQATAALCAETWNPVDSTGTQIEYRQGETEIIIDTLERTDTLYQPGQPIILYKFIKETQKRTDTASLLKYERDVNNARIIELQEKHRKENADKEDRISKLETQLNGIEIKRDNWRRLALIGWGIIALYIIIKWGWKLIKSWIVSGKIA